MHAAMKYKAEVALIAEFHCETDGENWQIGKCQERLRVEDSEVVQVSVEELRCHFLEGPREVCPAHSDNGCRPGKSDRLRRVKFHKVEWWTHALECLFPLLKRFHQLFVFLVAMQQRNQDHLQIRGCRKL
jgi:hypothetical protein